MLDIRTKRRAACAVRPSKLRVVVHRLAGLVALVAFAGALALVGGIDHGAELNTAIPNLVVMVSVFLGAFVAWELTGWEDVKK